MFFTVDFQRVRQQYEYKTIHRKSPNFIYEEIPELYLHWKWNSSRIVIRWLSSGILPKSLYSPLESYFFLLFPITFSQYFTANLAGITVMQITNALNFDTHRKEKSL